MTREEELQKVAEDAFKVCGSEFVKAIKRLWVTAFNAGAYWADRHPKDVWHDPEEEPNENTDILFIAKNGKVHKVSKVDNSLYSWLIDNKDIKRWAYITDLLSKGGAE